MKSLLWMLFATASLFFVSACNDEDNVDGPTGKIMLVNAAPATNGSVGFTLNDMKANVAAVAYGSNSGYVTVKNGTYDMKILNESQDPLYHDAKLAIQSGRHYSVYLYGTESLQAFKVEDDLRSGTSTQARVRFFNFVENIPAINLVAVSEVTLTPIFADRAGETTETGVAHAAFTNIDAGVLQIAAANSLSEEFLVETQQVDLKAGASYTIIASGAVGSTDYPVKLTVIKNK